MTVEKIRPLSTEELARRVRQDVCACADSYCVRRNRVDRLAARVEDAELREQAALAVADREQARVDQLSDELALTRDTLTHRTRALNETGATNDTLRAQLAAVRKITEERDLDARAYGFAPGEGAVRVAHILAILNDPGPVS